jgi:hypothetical protein
VLAAVDGGSTAGAVALRFGVSVSCICKALARRWVTGETQARAQAFAPGPEACGPACGDPQPRWPAVRT